jgi:hypothetical protein
MQKKTTSGQSSPSLDTKEASTLCGSDFCILVMEDSIELIKTI